MTDSDKLTFIPVAYELDQLIHNGDGYVSIYSDASIYTPETDLSPLATVAKTATGEYTITLTNAYVERGSVTAQLTTDTSGSMNVVSTVIVGDNTSTAGWDAQTIVVRTINGSGAATDPNFRCGFYFHFRYKNRPSDTL